MASTTRKRKTETITRTILADNVRALMIRQYRLSDNRPKELAKAAGTSLSTIQRVLEGKSGASVDTIHQIARAFDVSPYQLLIPALNPTNPQAVRGATKEEQRLYELFAKQSRSQVK